MERTLSLESQHIAEQLRTLIKRLEAATWHEELTAISSQLSELSAHIQTLLQNFEQSQSDAVMEALRERLHALGRYVEERMPHLDHSAEHFKQEWRAYKQKLILSYESLAATLKLQDIHVPNLRPTNYKRNLFHAGNGLFVLVLIMHVAPWSVLQWVSLGFCSWAWSMELGRRYFPWLNRALMSVLGPFAHPHEHYRVNSATWFATALVLLAYLTSPLLAALSVMILALADPAAALIGRRWGKTKLYSGRTLEGTLTFITVGTLASLSVMLLYTQLPLSTILPLALGGAIPAALAELYSKRIDDNLSIPLAASIGTSLIALLLNTPL